MMSSKAKQLLLEGNPTPGLKPEPPRGWPAGLALRGLQCDARLPFPQSTQGSMVQAGLATPLLSDTLWVGTSCCDSPPQAEPGAPQVPGPLGSEPGLG